MASLKIYISAKDEAEIKQKAKSEGLSMSEYCRKKIVGENEENPATIERKLEQVWDELKYQADDMYFLRCALILIFHQAGAVTGNILHSLCYYVMKDKIDLDSALKIENDLVDGNKFSSEKEVHQAIDAAKEKYQAQKEKGSDKK